MKTFVISDTHFRHGRIIKYCNRPFHSVEEMNECLVRNWNAVVAPADTVYHLGDFGFGDLSEFRSRLNGDIHLIQGNHDSSTTWNTFTFVSRQKHRLLNVGGLRVLLIHYPIHQPEYQKIIPDCEFDVCLYGHVHNNHNGWIQLGNRWYRNCSVEVHNYQPQLIQDMLQPQPMADNEISVLE